MKAFTAERAEIAKKKKYWGFLPPLSKAGADEEVLAFRDPVSVSFSGTSAASQA